jgi:nuclear transport factor 2 (NTF2) superfamily protein
MSPLPPFTLETAAQKASINDVALSEAARLFRWPLGPRPEGHPRLSDLGL